MKKILICGVAGQLGSALWDFFQDSSYELYGTFNQTVPRIDRVNKSTERLFQLDVRNIIQAQELIKTINPEVVINTTSLTHVDNCEQQQPEAYAINVVGNRNLLQSIPKPAFFVYISTYYVFDGTAGEYNEVDLPNPINYYGKTKLWAEQDCTKNGNSLIIRASKIFGLRDSRNFVARLTESLQHNQEMALAEDQYTNPILAEDLARIIKELIDNQAKGIYNVGGVETVSNYQFAAAWAEFMGWNPSLIKRIRTEYLHQAAPRPKECSLGLQKILQLEIKPLSLQQSFEQLKNKYENRKFNGKYRTG